MYEGMIAETVRIWGNECDLIDTYIARPLGKGPFPGVVLIHHMPGWDEGQKEIARKFAYHGYICIAPNLHHRMGFGDIDDAVAAVRAAGGTPDAQFLGDFRGAIHYLKSLSYHNGKIGCIGFCSGGRQAYIAACNVPELDTAIDCWGGKVVMEPADISERQPISPIEMTPQMNCSILGIFGNEDSSPSIQEVNEIESALQKHKKKYQFYRYDGAGHAFVNSYRPSYCPEQALDAWGKIFNWLQNSLM